VRKLFAALLTRLMNVQ
uniref:Uncharacterized protein n=1 Tax=Globodera pallida TaxID=36090 RepID=A0A183CSE8_GLOPA